MKVIVNNNTYSMRREQFRGLLKIAKAEVKNGIIAIKKNKIVEMRKDTFSSNSEKKRKIEDYKALGYKVYVS